MSLNRGPDWHTVVCVASGPSLKFPVDDQLDLIRAARARGSIRLIVTNTSWRDLPQADILWGCDTQWWKLYANEVLASFPGEKWTRSQEAAARWGLTHIPSYGKPGLTTLPGAIHEGGNSGYQAINLAYVLGARRILLAGYDMQRTNGMAHHHGEHPQPLSRSHPFASWIPRFIPLAQDLAAQGVEVLNCTRATALTCFPRADLAASLP